MDPSATLPGSFLDPLVEIILRRSIAYHQIKKRLGHRKSGLLGIPKRKVSVIPLTLELSDNLATVQSFSGHCIHCANETEKCVRRVVVTPQPMNIEEAKELLGCGISEASEAELRAPLVCYLAALVGSPWLMSAS
jgi:hypothetical protein